MTSKESLGALRVWRVGDRVKVVNGPVSYVGRVGSIEELDLRNQVATIRWDSGTLGSVWFREIELLEKS